MGKKVTCAVNEESIWWTNSSKLVNTHPLRAFIIMSIFSFIIYISWTMRIASASISKGRLVSSKPSNLLGTLLSSWSSISYLSPVDRWLPFYSSTSRPSHGPSWHLPFLWFSCCSNSQLRWVSRSTTTGRVCNYLSKAFEGFPISQLMVAIKCVQTMQLFHLRSSDMLNHSCIPHRQSQLMMC